MRGIPDVLASFMRLCLPHRVLAALLLLLLQEPAMLVQEIAWARMLVTYTKEKGVAGGIVDTFSGKRPCQLCLKAADMRGESRDDKTRPETEIPRLAMVLQKTAATPRFLPDPARANARHWPRPEHVRGHGRSDPPDTPPPEYA